MHSPCSARPPARPPARRLRLVTEEQMEVNLDGEIAAMAPATFEVDHIVLHVVVPAHSRAVRMEDTPSP